MKTSSSGILIALTLCSCVQKMGTQGHLRPQEGNPALVHLSVQVPEGTVPQTTSESPLPKIITRTLLEQGREQYQISCMPCHGPSGHGDGVIVQRGFLAPPSYHTERLRSVPDSHYFDVITHGYGAMYSYADRVSKSDRWAIVAYIRALQFSQNAKNAELPIQDQEKLKKEGTHD